MSELCCIRRSVLQYCWSRYDPKISYGKDRNSVYLPKDLISLISCRLIDKYVFVTLTTFTTKERITNQRGKVSAIVLLVRMPAKISEQSKNELIINVMLC